MANCVFAYPNFADSSATYSPGFSGGGWEASLPLTNLQSRHLHEVARSTSDSNGNTQLDVDLGVLRPVQVVALIAHNLSLAALVRIRGSNIAGDFSSPVYTSGWLDAFSVIYPSGSLPWGHPSFWTGKLSAEELAEGYTVAFIRYISSPQLARYWRIEFDDTSNPDGYVEVGRLVLAAAYQPTINMVYGAKLGFDDETTREVGSGGRSTFYDVKPVRRRFGFTIEGLPEDEAFSNVFDMQRRLGKSGQLFFIFDPSDTAHMHRRAFLCVMQELSPLDFPYLSRNSVGFELVEEL